MVVPTTKDDRVDAAIRAFGATPELVADVVPLPDLRDLSRQAGTSAKGSAVQLAERVIVAVEESAG